MTIGLRHYDIAGSALQAFSTLDNSFRADRREKADEEERTFQRDRQTRSDARADEAFDRQKQDWARDDNDRLLASALYKTQQYEAAKQQGQNPGQAPQYTPEEAQALGRLSRDKKAPWVATSPSQLPQYINDLTIADQLAAKLKLLPENARLRVTDPDALAILGRLDGERSVKAHENGTQNQGYNSIFVDGPYLLSALNVRRPDGSVVAMPATEGASTEDTAPVRRVTREEFAGKTQGALLANKALAYSLQQYEPDQVYSSKDLEAAIVANGGKGAGEIVARQKSLNKVTGLLSSDTFKKATEGEFAPVVQMMAELAKQGLATDKELSDALKLATTKDVENKIKGSQDETEARTAVLGYVGLDDTMPRTAALAQQLQQLMEAGKISGKRAAKMLDLAYAAEQRSQDNAAKIAAAKAGRQPREESSTALIKNAEFLVNRGIVPDYQAAYQALNTSKDNPEALMKTLISEGMKNNALLPEPKTPQQIVQEAKEVVSGLYPQRQGGGQASGSGQQAAPTATDQAVLLNQSGPAGGLTGPRAGIIPPKPSSKGSRNKALQFFD